MWIMRDSVGSTTLEFRVEEDHETVSRPRGSLEGPVWKFVAAPAGNLSPAQIHLNAKNLENGFPESAPRPCRRSVLVLYQGCMISDK